MGDQDRTIVAADIPTRTSRDIKELSLVRDDVYVLSFIDGASSVDDLATLTGRTHEQVCQIMHRLLELGAIQLSGRGEPRARGAAPSGPSAGRAAPSPSLAKPSTVSPECVPRLTQKSATRVDIGVQDGFLLSQIDGATPVSELAEILGAAMDDLATALLRLEAAGAITWSRPEGGVRAGAVKRGPPVAVDVFSTPRQRHTSATSRANASRVRPPSDRARPRVPPPAKVEPSVDRPHKKVEPRATPTSRPPRPPSVTRSAAAARDRPVPKKSSSDVKAAPPPAPSSAALMAAPSTPTLDVGRPSIPSAPASIPEPAPSSGGRRRALIRINTDRFGVPPAPVRVSEDAAAPRQTLTGMSPPPASASRPDVAPATAPAAVGALGTFFARTTEKDGREHARVFAEAAEYELGRGNVIGAAAQFQLAYNACKAPELRMAFEAVEAEAQERRYDMHKARAESAERDARWPDAASAYARVYATRPKGHIAERYANALRMASGDLREAVKLADEAVRHDPRHAGYRVTLGEVCLAAGLELRAQGEAKRAFELAPSDPRVLALVAAVAKLPPPQ